MKNKIEIPIMFCFDTNYVIPAAAAFYSLMEHANKNYKYRFFVLHSNISDEQQKKLKETIIPFSDNCVIEFVDMADRFSDLWDSLTIKGHFTKDVMYKILVSSIFPNYEKIIVSDVDVIFLGDLSESYINFDVSDDYYIAGVKPVGKVLKYMDNYKKDFSEEEIEILSNICGGYAIFNLRKLREDCMEDKFIDCFKKEGYRLNQCEQDVLNLVCYPKIKRLHLKYCTCSYQWDMYVTEKDFENDKSYSKKELEESMENPIQLHYATSIKPWKNTDCTKSEEWFKYIVKTPFLEEYLKSLPHKIIVPKDRLVKNFKNFSSSKIGRILGYIKRNPLFFININLYKKVLEKIYKRINNNKDVKLIIIDDVFPSEESPFRYEEYTSYLDFFSNCNVLLTGKTLEYIKESKSIEELFTDIVNINPKYTNKLVKEYDQIKDGKIAILTFLSNVYENLDFLEKHEIPFIFTLYPGGTFILNDEQSDEKLKKVFSSKYFRKVIVNQKITYDYLTNNILCSSESIEYIYGGVTPKVIQNYNKKDKKYYKINKKTLDICFVAHKYSKGGLDKGFDIFIEVAKLLSKNKDVKFHVIGSFSIEDLNDDKLGNVQFHGALPSYELQKLFYGMDIILSPNRPFVLSKGSFDGFPTGSCTEAMLNGVCAFCSDELKVNNDFINKKEIEIIDLNPKNIVDRIKYYMNNSNELKSLSVNGRKKAIKIYSYKNQIIPRIKLLLSEIKKIRKKND